MSIIEKYNLRADKTNSLVCVGLDSAISKIPERFQKSENPQFEFNKCIIDSTAEFAAAYKPNMAFYEARGNQGLGELKLTMEYLQTKHPDILTICDAKRADIGSTNEAYAKAIFDYLGFDAVTLHPYLGKVALKPFLDRKDKACVILCRTSNPGAAEFQDLDVKGQPLWLKVAQNVARNWNGNGNCMLVAGATYPAELKLLRQALPDMIFLVPGIGAQGGSVEEVVKNGLDKNGRGLIINSSRGVIFAENPAQEAKKLKDETNRYRQFLNLLLSEFKVTAKSAKKKAASHPNLTRVKFGRIWPD